MTIGFTLGFDETLLLSAAPRSLLGLWLQDSWD